MVSGPQDTSFQVVVIEGISSDDAGQDAETCLSKSKKCSGCKQVKSSDAFHKSKKRSDGLQVSKFST